MHIIWQKNEIGHIALDLGAIRSFITTKLHKDEEVSNLYFDATTSNLVCMLQVQNYEEARVAELKEALSPMFESAGFSFSLGVQELIRLTDQLVFYKSPFFWGVLFALIYIFGCLGLDGIFWCAFCAVLGYAVSWFFVTQTGKNYTDQFVKKLKQTMNGFKS